MEEWGRGKGCGRRRHRAGGGRRGSQRRRGGSRPLEQVGKAAEAGEEAWVLRVEKSWGLEGALDRFEMGGVGGYSREGAGGDIGLLKGGGVGGGRGEDCIGPDLRDRQRILGSVSDVEQFGVARGVPGGCGAAMGISEGLKCDEGIVEEGVQVEFSNLRALEAKMFDGPGGAGMTGRASWAECGERSWSLVDWATSLASREVIPVVTMALGALLGRGQRRQRCAWLGPPRRQRQ